MDDITSSSESEEKVTPPTVNVAFSTFIQKTNDVKAKLLGAAQNIGYIQDAIMCTEPLYNKLAQSEDFRPIVVSGLKLIHEIENSITGIYVTLTPGITNITNLCSSAETFMNTSGSIAFNMAAIEPVNAAPFEEPLLFSSDEAEIVSKLTILDPSLGATYREIGQTYHGTTADPIRTSLFLMRQVFDHLFDVLAPNDLVRGSSYWKPKDITDEEMKVTRRERITYAANVHITDLNKANLIIAQITHILAVYDSLNILHTRGELPEEKAQMALRSMKKFIHLWLDAMSL